jgi:hypothetical protein
LIAPSIKCTRKEASPEAFAEFRIIYDKNGKGERQRLAVAMSGYLKQT